MRRVYKKVEKFRFEGSTSPLNRGDVVVLHLNTGDINEYYVASCGDPQAGSTCIGCEFFTCESLCPELGRIYIDRHFMDKCTLEVKRALSGRRLCTGRQPSSSHVIFKAFGTVMEEL